MLVWQMISTFPSPVCSTEDWHVSFSYQCFQFSDCEWFMNRISSNFAKMTKKSAITDPAFTPSFFTLAWKLASHWCLKFWDRKCSKQTAWIYCLDREILCSIIGSIGKPKLGLPYFERDCRTSFGHKFTYCSFNLFSIALLREVLTKLEMVLEQQTTILQRLQHHDAPAELVEGLPIEDLSGLTAMEQNLQNSE